MRPMRLTKDGQNYEGLAHRVQADKQTDCWQIDQDIQSQVTAGENAKATIIF